jgi:hypothetical protein
MAPDPDEVQILLQDALAALKVGDKNTAHNLAERAAFLAPESEAPWLILAAVASPEESLTYVKKALQINPESKSAQQALEWTLKRQSDRSPASETKPSREQAHPPISPAVPVETMPEPEPPSKPIHPPTGPVSLTDILPRAAPSSPPAMQRKKLSLSRTHIFILSALGLVVIALFVFVLALGSGSLVHFQQSISELLNPIPTPQCIQPVLKIGGAQLPIKSIARAADGSLPIPAQPENAFWVEGTNINYVFVLSPTPNNNTLSTDIKTGANITISWADCTTEEYVVNTIDSQVPIDSSLFDQSHGGVTIVQPTSSSLASLIIHAVRPEALTPVTPEPTNPNQIQAQIDFGETSLSEDGRTFQINLTVTNTGSVAIPLSTSDLSISSESAQPIYPMSVEPPLPQEIQPGESLSLTATFPNPDDKNSVLNVLDTSIELYFLLP